MVQIGITLRYLEGAILELEVNWPDYLANTNLLNGKWIAGTGDGSFGMNDSHYTNAVRNTKDTIREFGARNTTSTVTFFLLQKVYENVLSTVIDKLGSLKIRRNGEGKQPGYTSADVCHGVNTK